MDTRRLPLWKDFLETALRSQRLTYGAFFSIEELESAVGHKRDTVAFNFAMSEIKQALEKIDNGAMVWTARGQYGRGYVISPPETCTAEMQNQFRQGLHLLGRSVRLGVNTPTHLLSDEQRRKHEALLEKNAKRLALVNRRALPAALKQKAIN
jgi:hypothetical protein